MNQVVLFGGTFDPPHVGHYLMAQLALEQSGADELWFLPAPVPPHKLDISPSPYHVRVQMVRTMIGASQRMRVCEIEAELPKPSYTADTVQALLGLYPGVLFSFLIGSDSLAQLPTWHECERLSEQIRFLVATRSGFPFTETLEQTKHRLPALQAAEIAMPTLDVSSTWLRDRLDLGLPVCGLVPDAVLELWRSGRRQKNGQGRGA